MVKGACVLGARDPKLTLNTASQLLKYKYTIYQNSARSGSMIPQYYWALTDQVPLKNLSCKNHLESLYEDNEFRINR